MTKENFEILVKRVKGARSMRLKIGRNGQPVLTLPYWIPKSIGLIWAKKKEDWIQKNTFVPTKFHEGQTIFLFGQEVQIKHNELREKTHIKQGILWVSGEKSFLPRRVADFIKKEFKSYLPSKIDEKEHLLGVKHTHIMIKDTHSQWGSCSSKGILNFCWRLAMAPEFVIDYLIAHEVAHLKHMNHSRHFWETVALLTPYTVQAQKWLKKYGRNLPTLK